jgi:hypothetical protein
MTAALLQALPAILSVVGGLTGKGASQGSTYSKNARGLIDEAINSVRGMKGAQDITQQPGYQTGLGWLQDMFNDQGFFDRFEAPLQRQFQEQTVPELANRFAGMGSGGALGSTGFRNQLAREGSNLSTNLAALRGGMQQQAIPQLLGYSQQPFSNYMSLLNQALTPTMNQYRPASGGFGTNIGAAGIGGLSNIWGNQYGQEAANPSIDTGQGYGAGWDQDFRRGGVVP